MKINLKNIGTLHEASFDLDKDLIVFVGPNNTGKTYASYITYALNRYAMGLHLPLINNILASTHVEELSKYGETTINLWELFLQYEEAFSKAHSNEVNNSLYQIFDTERDFFRNSSIGVTFHHDSIRRKLYPFSFNKTTKFGASILKYEKKDGSHDLRITTYTQHNDLPDPKSSGLAVSEVITWEIYDLIIERIFNKPYIAPAERIAINLFSKQLSIQRNRAFNQVLLASKDKSQSNHFLDQDSLYPLPIRDCLEIAERLMEYQKRDSDFSFLATLFENNILQGKIAVSEYGAMQFHPKGEKVEPLGIHLSASMVKSLSSIVFYFRHIAEKNDFIIIDEPELNLHPDNQRKVTRLIARMVNAGFKVLISTHSDYIIRELNNLIMLNKEHPDTIALREKYGYEASEILDYKRVGAYLFKDNTAKEIEVTETGMEAATIDEEINKLNNTATDIYWTLFED